MPDALCFSGRCVTAFSEGDRKIEAVPRGAQPDRGAIAVDSREYYWYPTTMAVWKPLNDLAYHRIRAGIQDGSRLPRQPLSESHLARELGISRTPVREALKRLAVEGWVDIFPRRGTFVSVPDITKLREIFQMREALEGMATRLATARMSQAELGRFQQRFEASYRARNVEQFSAAGREFHAAIIGQCDNARLADYLLTIRSQIRNAFSMGIRLHGRIDRSYREYLAIIGAMKRGDAKRAEAAMRQHIVSVRKNLLHE
jgi:DNA-binding GntR family transcriptional regulator